MTSTEQVPDGPASEPGVEPEVPEPAEPGTEPEPEPEPGQSGSPKTDPQSDAHDDPTIHPTDPKVIPRSQLDTPPFGALDERLHRSDDRTDSSDSAG